MVNCAFCKFFGPSRYGVRPGWGACQLITIDSEEKGIPAVVADLECLGELLVGPKFGCILGEVK